MNAECSAAAKINCIVGIIYIFILNITFQRESRTFRLNSKLVIRFSLCRTAHRTPTETRGLFWPKPPEQQRISDMHGGGGGESAVLFDIWVCKYGRYLGYKSWVDPFKFSKLNFWMPIISLLGHYLDTIFIWEIKAFDLILNMIGIWDKLIDLFEV